MQLQLSGMSLTRLAACSQHLEDLGTHDSVAIRPALERREPASSLDFFRYALPTCDAVTPVKSRQDGLTVTIRDEEVSPFRTGTRIHRKVRKGEILFRDQADDDENRQGGERVPKKPRPRLPRKSALVERPFIVGTLQRFPGVQHNLRP